MTHYYYAFAREALSLVAVEQLPEGEDPPDYCCRDRAGRCIGVELVELVDERERQTNTYRRTMVKKHGRHDASLDVPPGSTPGFARMLTERTVMKRFSTKQGLQLIARQLQEKERKLSRKREAEQGGWPYDEIIVLAWTTNWSLANRPFFEAARTRAFGPFAVVNRAFLVPQPFYADFGDTFIELQVRYPAPADEASGLGRRSP